jgi:lipoyl(octanoyl) transferase
VDIGDAVSCLTAVGWNGVNVTVLPGFFGPVSEDSSVCVSPRMSPDPGLGRRAAGLQWVEELGMCANRQAPMRPAYGRLAAVSELRFVHLGFGSGAVEYHAAWQEQRRVHTARFADEIPDTCLLLEHQSVYTAGRRTEDSERPLDGTPVVDVDRGGKITWHGPGQLVGYPILKLPRPVDVVAHVRRIEEAIIRACAEFGLETTRVEGRSGVWVLGEALPGGADRQGALGSLALDFDPRLHDEEFDPRLSGPEYAPSNAGQRGEDRKLCNIGIRVAKGVTMHGFALNCNTDNTAYDRIVPCGIRDAGVTSLSEELGREVTVTEVVPVVEKHLRAVLEESVPLPRAV